MRVNGLGFLVKGSLAELLLLWY